MSDTRRLAGERRSAQPEAAAYRRRRWWLALLTLAVCALTARLGWWQLERAQFKRDTLARLTERDRLAPLQAGQLARDALAAQQQHQRRVLLRGRWLAAQPVALDNRVMNGRPGFIVLMPLLLDGQREAVLVQRGWLPRDARDRSRLPPLHTGDGVVQLLGRVVPPPSPLWQFSDAPERGLIRQNLLLEPYAREIGQPLLPLSVQQLTPELPAPPADAAQPALLRDWPQPALDIGKHQGYALQWFAMCALAAGLYVWFQILRPLSRWRRRVVTASEAPVPISPSSESSPHHVCG